MYTQDPGKEGKHEADKTKSWFCDKCANLSSNVSVDPDNGKHKTGKSHTCGNKSLSQSSAKIKCDMCTKNINKNHLRLQCKSCNCVFHIKL